MQNRIRQRGTVYLMLLATGAIVTVLGLTGLALVRAQSKGDQAMLDMMDARAGARAAVEQAAALIELTPGWRSQLAGSGGSFGEFTVGRGKISTAVSDPVDGNLTNWPADPVEILGTGKFGGSEQLYSMRLNPVPTPLACLAFAATAGANISVTGGVVCGKGGVASNANITAGSARVTVPVRAVGNVNGGTYSGGYQSSAAAVAMPSAAALFAYYKSIGTEIPTSALSGRRLEYQVLSPTRNPWVGGSAGLNARGVYWVDLQGNDVELRNLRVHGTLVLLNCKADSIVASSLNIEPFDPSLPALLVQGSINFQISQAPLSESDLGINFNPASAPYAGQSDSDLLDDYPSRIKGLVYISSDLNIPGEMTVDGVLIVGARLTINGMLALHYDDRSLYSAPPGFEKCYSMSLVPGSFSREVH